MMLAHFVGINSPDIMNPRIGSITAVLRNNYWLTIHVLTIVSSYGAGGLAWGLGNLAMLFYLFGKYRGRDTASRRLSRPPVHGPAAATAARASISTPFTAAANRRWPRGSKKAGKALKPTMLPRTIKAGFEDFGTGDEHLEAAKVRPPKEAATLASYTYKAQQVAVLLLAAGTILGGLWADVSWGRFWDWDPKEVWALISLLAYLVVLHGRFAGWVGTFGTNCGGVLAFLGDPVLVVRRQLCAADGARLAQRHEHADGGRPARVRGGLGRTGLRVDRGGAEPAVGRRRLGPLCRGDHRLAFAIDGRQERNVTGRRGHVGPLICGKHHPTSDRTFCPIRPPGQAHAAVD